MIFSKQLQYCLATATTVLMLIVITLMLMNVGVVPEGNDDPESLKSTIKQLEYKWKPKNNNKITILQSFRQMMETECSTNAKSILPEYREPLTLIEYLQHSEDRNCVYWRGFGGEKLEEMMELGKNFSESLPVEYKRKYICFDKEYRLNENNCLIYAFSEELQNQFERDLSKYGCEVHSFQQFQNFSFVNSKKNSHWLQHNWRIYTISRRISKKIVEGDGTFIFDRRFERTIVNLMQLEEIVQTLGHDDKTIDYVSSNDYPAVWTLLQQIVLNHKKINIRQVGVGFYLPESNSAEERNKLFGSVYDVFRGMACVGYVVSKIRPITLYNEYLEYPEFNGSVHAGYEITFLKDQNGF